MKRKTYATISLLVLGVGAVPFAATADDAKAAAPAPASAAAASGTPAAAPRKPPSGWRIVMRGETVYWCTKQPNFGSRTRGEERCLTPEQYDQLEKDSQDIVEGIRRASPPPKGG
jgi:hypothetical protein